MSQSSDFDEDVAYCSSCPPRLLQLPNDCDSSSEREADYLGLGLARSGTDTVAILQQVEEQEPDQLLHVVAVPGLAHHRPRYGSSGGRESDKLRVSRTPCEHDAVCARMRAAKAEKARRRIEDEFVVAVGQQEEVQQKFLIRTGMRLGLRLKRSSHGRLKGFRLDADCTGQVRRRAIPFHLMLGAGFAAGARRAIADSFSVSRATVDKCRHVVAAALLWVCDMWFGLLKQLASSVGFAFSVHSFAWDETTECLSMQLHPSLCKTTVKSSWHVLVSAQSFSLGLADGRVLTGEINRPVVPLVSTSSGSLNQGCGACDW